SAMSRSFLSVAGRWSVVVGPGGWSIVGGALGVLLAGHFVEFAEFGEDLIVTTVADAFDDAGVEVAGEHDRFNLLDGASDGLGLLEDIDAVVIRLDHALDAGQVAFDKVDALEDVGFGGVLQGLSHTP